MTTALVRYRQQRWARLECLRLIICDGFTQMCYNIALVRYWQ